MAESDNFVLLLRLYRKRAFFCKNESATFMNEEEQKLKIRILNINP